MATLTGAEKAYIRAKSGDICTPYVVGDVLMQVYFDTAESSLPKTIVSVLEDRWAKAKADVGRVTDFGVSVDRADMDHIEDLLDYWRTVAYGSAKPLGSVSTGVLALDIDFTESDLQE